jgi:hypothetical protein
VTTSAGGQAAKLLSAGVETGVQLLRGEQSLNVLPPRCRAEVLAKEREKSALFPIIPFAADRASRSGSETCGVAVRHDQTPRSWHGRPGDKPRVDPFVAEAVADDQQLVCGRQRLVEAKVLRRVAPTRV